MTRRSFARAIAGVAVVTGGGIPVAAVYGARLPQTLRIPRRIASRYGWFELRAYTGETERLAGLFARSGIRAHLLGYGWSATRFLFPFPSLEERGRTWDRLNGDLDWLLTRGQVRLTEVTIYRLSEGGL
ncbi:MAG TPA: hypothetical protein VIY49_21390 [Bryobacteraceae bacterium]